MIRLLLLTFLFSFTYQGGELRREVARVFPDGSPKVVIYYSKDETSYVKEEVFYPSGQMNYYGHYQNQLEHGEWKYFWKNGQVKFLEFYENGLEHGEMYDYDWRGVPQKKYVYWYGELIEESEL